MLVAAIVGLFLSKPLLYNFHDGQAEIFLRKYGWLVKKIIRDNPVIVASGFVEKAFRQYGFKTRQISNHFDFEETLPCRKKPFQWNQKIIWARSFCALYQPELALKVAQKVVTMHPSCEFHFFGDGELHQELQAQYNHPRILFKGFVARTKFLKEYENYSVFFNTTAYDNFPLSIVEAAHYELLVVSSRVGGVASVYNENEILFWDDNKPDELAEILYEIMSRPDQFDSYRFKLRMKTQRFTWKNVRELWLGSIYERLPAAKRKPGRQVCAEFVAS